MAVVGIVVEKKEATRPGAALDATIAALLLFCASPEHHVRHKKLMLTLMPLIMTRP